MDVEDETKCVVCNTRRRRKGRKACSTCWDLTGAEGTREKFGLTKETPLRAAIAARVKSFNSMVRNGKTREEVCEAMGINVRSLSPWMTRMRQAGFRLEPCPASIHLGARELILQLENPDLPPRQRKMMEGLLAKLQPGNPVTHVLEGIPPLNMTVEQLRKEHQCPTHGRVYGELRGLKQRNNCPFCKSVRRWCRIIHVRNWRKKDRLRREEGQASVAEMV